MGVELMTPGNWEFGFGPEVLRERAAEMNFLMIACNVVQATTGEGVSALRRARDWRDARRTYRRYLAHRCADNAQGLRGWATVL